MTAPFSSAATCGFDTAAVVSAPVAEYKTEPWPPYQQEFTHAATYRDPFHPMSTSVVSSAICGATSMPSGSRATPSAEMRLTTGRPELPKPAQLLTGRDAIHATTHDEPSEATRGVDVDAGP